MRVLLRYATSPPFFRHRSATEHMSVVVPVRKGLYFASTTYLLPQSSQPLLLGVRIDVCADNKRYEIEERDPSVLGQELLGKRQRQR